MTQEEFQKQIKRLADVYGERNYPPERAKMIWRKLGHYHEKVFNEAVDTVIADNAQAPMLTKLREAVYAAQRLFPELASDPHAPTRKEILEGQKSKSECRKCWNWGIILARRKDIEGNPLESLVCPCRWGTLAAQLPENRSCPRWLHYYDYYYALDSDPESENILKKFRHVSSLPKQDRINELVRLSVKDMGV
jgi:hypothetical protein